MVDFAIVRLRAARENNKLVDRLRSDPQDYIDLRADTCPLASINVTIRSQGCAVSVSNVQPCAGLNELGGNLSGYFYSAFVGAGC